MTDGHGTEAKIDYVDGKAGRSLACLEPETRDTLEPA